MTGANSIDGTHLLLFTTDPAADAFLRNWDPYPGPTAS